MLHHDDPMRTGIPRTPGYQRWKAKIAALIDARYPNVAADVIAAGAWLEAWEDRALRTPDDTARWLVEARCAEMGVLLPEPEQGGILEES